MTSAHPRLLRGHLGPPNTAWRRALRIATSPLYGAILEQRRTALAVDEPGALPWLAQAQARLGDELCALARTGQLVSGS